MGLAAFLKDYGAGIPWVVAVAGWVVGNRQANQREKRKEVRAEIEAIEKVVQSIAEKLALYLRRPLADTDEQVKELEIIVLFQSVDRRVERLKKRQSGGTLGLYLDTIDRDREEFYDFSTGQYFQTPVRLSEPDLSERITGVHARGQILIESLHAFFLMKFDGIRSSDVS